MLEDSLDLFMDSELEAVGRLPPGLVGVIPLCLSATSFASDLFRSFFLDATQTCYRRPWTLMDSEEEYQKFEWYVTFQPMMALTLLPP